MECPCSYLGRSSWKSGWASAGTGAPARAAGEAKVSAGAWAWGRPLTGVRALIRRQDCPPNQPYKRGKPGDVKLAQPLAAAGYMAGLTLQMHAIDGHCDAI